MTLEDAIITRHSVRSYLEKSIDKQILEELNQEILKYNKDNNLNIQLVTNEPKAFSTFLAHYGRFENVTNYIALVGEKSDDLHEKLGYYGQKLVLKAQTLGLNTCWVAGTFSKRKAKVQVGANEKLVCVIALGHGKTFGTERKSKPLSELYQAKQPIPPWFISGIEAAALAPTAMNQQKFVFVLENNIVSAKATGGFYSKVDLGIVKYHFEIGAGTNNFKWEE